MPDGGVLMARRMQGDQEAPYLEMWPTWTLISLTGNIS